MFNIKVRSFGLSWFVNKQTRWKHKPQILSSSKLNRHTNKSLPLKLFKNKKVQKNMFKLTLILPQRHQIKQTIN